MACVLARGVEQRIGTDKVPLKRTEGALPLNSVLYTRRGPDAHTELFCGSDRMSTKQPRVEWPTMRPNISLAVGVAGPSAQVAGTVSRVRGVRLSTRAQRPRPWRVASRRSNGSGLSSSWSHDGEVITLGQGTSLGLLRTAPSTSRGLRASSPALEAAPKGRFLQ